MATGRILEPDWREGSGYAALRCAEPAAFAWEWLRRDRSYRLAAAGALQRARSADLTVLPSDPAAARWGLHAFEDPALPAAAARPVWRRDWCARVLVADARAAGPLDDRLDLARFAALATVVRAAGGAEHLLLCDGAASLRIDIVSGSLLAGPVRLSYRLAGLTALRGPLETLCGLARLARSGRLPRAAVRERNRRLVLLLRAGDALRGGATQREVAGVLLNAEASRRRWRTEVPGLRSRAQRLAQGARALAGGGYRGLLRA